MSTVAAYIRGLDPRLKMAAALALGPALWKIHIFSVSICCLLLIGMVWRLAAIQPLGAKMIRSLMVFVLFWMGIKVVLDGLTGVPLDHVAFDALQLGVRLVALLMLGLALSLSTSPRSLGLAVSWVLRPLIGQERAWRMALSLALMIHFLPTCLSTMNGVRDVARQRCPDMGLVGRFRMVPQAIIRNLGQKTWNQTLAVACRGVDSAESWAPDFTWTGRDTYVGFVLIALFGLFFVA